MKRTALVLLITAGALVAAGTASPQVVERVETFTYHCRENARQAINLTYNQRIRYSGLAGSEPIEPWRRPCLIEPRQPFAALPRRSKKAMTFRGRR